MKQIKDLFFKLIRFELGEQIGEDDKNLIRAIDQQKLFDFSKKHDLAHLVGDAMSKLDLINDEKIKKAFNREKDLAIYRYVKIEYELGQLSEVLDNAKIPFIPLKGAVIRALYPEAWMRTSCDIDVLIKKEHLECAVSVLNEKLSYEYKSCGEHDAQIYAPSGVHLELHFSLQEKETSENLAQILDSVWDRSTNLTDYLYEMPNEFLYCYLLSHTAKHVKWGGCGIRPLIDLYILNQKLNFDQETKLELLSKGGLLNFALAIEKLSRVWFCGEQADENTTLLEEYILSGGVYGNLENKVASRQNKKKNKFTYFLSRLFIPYKELKIKYPRLQKCPLLYPYYTVKRWLKPIFNKESKRRMKNELKQSKMVGQDLQEKTKNLFNYLEI